MIDKLEMLIALAQERHFGRAASACNVTQPTLSSGIKTLEDLLGVQLVNRGHRYLGLTAEGEQVLQRARSIVAEARAMRAEVATVPGKLSGTLRIGAIPTALIDIRRYTASFMVQNPQVRVQIRSMTSQEIAQALVDFEIDVGMSYAEADLNAQGPQGLDVLPLYRERYALLTATRPGLPVRLDWGDLPDFDLGLLTPDMQNRRILDRNLAQAGVKILPRLESTSILALISHVVDAAVSTILPSRIATFFAGLPDLTAIPIAEGSTEAVLAEVALILPRASRRGPLLKALVKHLNLDRNIK
ncbi:MAG: LysR family transcriptional regulator [Gemmobacter sp.]|nr:LysR family transcriptional regulator [Gemmobacter sp.]